MFNPRQLLWWASIAAESILLMRLVRCGLYTKYRWFAAYLASDILCSLGMMWLTPNPHSNAYALTWFSTGPILAALQTATAIELYRLISNHYRNFDQVRPRLFWTCLVTATAASVLTVAVDLRHITWTSPILQSVFLAKRVVTFALAGFVIVAAIFIRVFPIPIKPNVTVHRRLMTVYFLANAANYFAIGVGLLSTYAAGIALMAITAACFLAWAWLLTGEGEDVDVPPPPTDDEINQHLRRGEELLGRVRAVKQ